jgi:hypothetical protein
MDLATIEVTPEEAEAKFEEYSAAVKNRHDAEDEAIMRGYKALSRGTRLLSLKATMKAGGTETASFSRWESQGSVTRDMLIPQLAVIRADAKEVFCDGILMDGGVRFTMDRWPHHNATRRMVRVPDGTFEPVSQSRDTVKAMVPLIPPALRPRAALSNYHILFEAEWKPVPPKDPALLRHIGGDLYSIVAVWDLTELERAVLSERLDL